MTKSSFLDWLNQFRYVGNIKAVVEERAWTEPELDRLKDRLEKGGKLQRKIDFARRDRMRWG